MKKGSGRGYIITKKGYIRITNGDNRHKYFHRVKAAACMKESGLELTSNFVVNHLCGNRACPCPDFHLLIWPIEMAAIIDAGRGRPSKGRKNYVPFDYVPPRQEEAVEA